MAGGWPAAGRSNVSRAVGAVTLGIVLFGESAQPLRLLCVGLIVAGILLVAAWEKRVRRADFGTSVSSTLADESPPS